MFKTQQNVLTVIFFIASILLTGCNMPTAEKNSSTPVAAQVGAANNESKDNGAPATQAPEKTATQTLQSEDSVVEETHNIPPDGEWVINHISGQMVCPTLEQDLDPFNAPATISTENSGEIFNMLTDGEDIVLTRTNSGVTSATYEGLHINRENLELTFKIEYSYNNGEHYLEANFETNAEGCTFTRAFGITLVSLSN